MHMHIHMHKHICTHIPTCTQPRPPQDWLLLSYHKVRLVEFGLLWVTFLLICGLGLELGIALGIVGACLLFAYSYARVCICMWVGVCVGVGVDVVVVQHGICV